MQQPLLLRLLAGALACLLPAPLFLHPLACLLPPSLFLLPGPLPSSAPFLPQRRPGAPLPPQHAQPAPAPLQPQGAPSPPPPLRPLRAPPFTLQPPSPCAFPLPRSALPCSMPAGLLAGIAAGTAPCCRQAVHAAPPAEAFLHPLPSSPAPPRSYSHPPSLAAGTPLRALSTTRKGARVLMARSIQGARSAAAGCSSALHSLSQRSRGLQNTLQYITSYTASLHPTPAPPRPFAHKAYWLGQQQRLAQRRQAGAAAPAHCMNSGGF